MSRTAQLFRRCAASWQCTATSALHPPKGAPMAERWRGIYTILLTPFHEDRSLDEESLRREVDFVIAAGAHGIVTPVNTSEFFLLADDERRRLAEIVVDQSRGRVPVVIGTAAPATATAVALTGHAR